VLLAWHQTESQSLPVHFTPAVMACAGFYGIRQTYTVLAHLRWAIKPENATVTAMCLDILGNELKPLKQAEAEGALLPQVTTSSASATPCLITGLCHRVTGNHGLLSSSPGLPLVCLAITCTPSQYKLTARTLHEHRNAITLGSHSAWSFSNQQSMHVTVMGVLS